MTISLKPLKPFKDAALPAAAAKCRHLKDFLAVEEWTRSPEDCMKLHIRARFVNNLPMNGTGFMGSASANHAATPFGCQIGHFGR